MKRTKLNARQLQEELVLRNVNPFGVVFSEASEREAEATTGAYCATGDLGALEYWETIVEGKDVFFFCKARNVSQWAPPCRYLEDAAPRADPDDEDMTLIFPLAYEELDAYRPETPHEDETPAVPEPSEPVTVDLATKLAILATSDLEWAYLRPLFQFKGRLDGVWGVAQRARYTSVPHGLHDDQEHTPSEVEAIFASMARNLIIAEHNIEVSVQEHYDMPKIYTVDDINLEQRQIFATAWADLGDLALARDDGATAMNCYRRSIFWFHDFTASYVKAAALLTSLAYTDDSCDVLAAMPRDEATPIVELVPDLVSQFPHCKHLTMPWLSQKVRVGLRYMVAILVGTGVLYGLAYVCILRRHEAHETSIDAPASALRKRAKHIKKKTI
ncbi:hypothetical protein SPRG_19235 [Saprolegnia parasitica CBS 223.65]|uniref:Uncharacterized protein n=1 Tax=Saprolegnia parasitica (strain CBS 223.65) TaxID=695850 RepID=A0A067D3M0_SAPPC|nr:hypothetical protein SPRG_19235 [Saprolegnia parasitica CBS 223.65]KDO33607.1 hypothetical protein SPRG_19235 [Saprolegnia parasitica CBS 223.65]|eukprot:XP_012195655.1 hypothetical protein SPRG_19235 [Saprolegnia parasitica CBS 223.65]